MAHRSGDRAMLMQLNETKKDLFKELVEHAPKQEIRNTVHARTPKLSSLARSRRYEGGEIHFPGMARRSSSALGRPRMEERVETPDPIWIYQKKTQLRDKIRQHTSGGPTEIRQAFRDFDTNANGVIDAKEFRGFCNRMNLMLDKKEGLQLFNSYDKDSDGRIDFYEFVDKILNESDFKRPNATAFRGRDRMHRAKLARELLNNERELVNSREKLLSHELRMEEGNANTFKDMDEEERKKLLYSSPRHTHLVPIGPSSRNPSRQSGVSTGRRANNENALPPRPNSQFTNKSAQVDSARFTGRVSTRSAKYSQPRPESVPLPDTGRSHGSAAFEPLGSTRSSARNRESAESYKSVDLRREKRKYVKQILNELLTMDQRVEENEELFKDVLKEISKDRLTTVLDKVLNEKGTKSSVAL